MSPTLDRIVPDSDPPARHRSRRGRGRSGIILIVGTALISILTVSVVTGIITPRSSSNKIGPVETIKGASASCGRGVKLDMRIENELPAMGSHVWGVTITDRVRHTCSLRGFPTVTLLGPGTSPLNTDDVRSSTFPFQHTLHGTHTVYMSSSTPVSFLFTTGQGNGYTPKPRCPVITAAKIQLGTAQTRVVSFSPTVAPLRDTSGISSCDRITVSPLFQGAPRRGLSSTG